MKIRNLILSLMTFFAVVGCFKDKGNYEYTKLPEFSIKVATPSPIIVGEKAIFEVKPVFPEGVHYDLEYEWRVNEVVVPGATSAVFEHTATAVGYDRVLVTATEKKTRAKVYASSAVSIGALFESGFLILVEDGGNTDMHFIRAVEKRGSGDENDSLVFISEHTNIYKNLLGGAIEGTPVGLQEHWTWEASIPGEISVETKVNGKSKFSEYSGTTLSRETFVEQEFSGNALPENFRPIKMLYSSWDTFILDENSSAYIRRSSATDGFHTGLFDKNVTLWGNTKFADMFTCYHPDSNAFLAIEIDPITQQKSFVGILENIGKSSSSTSVEILSSKRLPLVPSQAEYNNFKGQVLFSDYFMETDNNGVQSFIINNENNELILQVIQSKVDNEATIDFFKTSKLNLAQHSISKVNGMFTSKTEYDRVIYVYDDSNIYSFVYDVEDGTFEFSKMLEFSGKTIVSASNQSMGRYRYEKTEEYLEYNLAQVEAHIGIAFSDGSFEIYELDNINPNVVTEKIYQNKENFGKIRQVIFKAGNDSNFSG